MKKAQGLSMNVIIVAVLALLVLVILSVVFTSKMRSTRENIDSCESSGGYCIFDDVDTYTDEALKGTPGYCDTKGYDRIKTQFGCQDNYVCCIKG